MASKRHLILEALKTQLTAQLTWAKSIQWENIRILASDFNDSEVPAVQFYHVRTDYEHQNGRVQARSLVNIELAMKSSASTVIDQRDLFDKIDAIIEAVGSNPNLGVAGVIHARLISDETDAFTIKPFLLGVVQFEIIYLTKYNGC